MCITALMQGKIGAARTFGEDGLALARDLDDDFRISVHCKNMCWLESEIRNFTDAEAHGMEGLRHAQRIGHRGELAGLLYHLGMLAAAQADLKLARARLRQGLRYALEANHRWYTAAIWNGWSEIHLGQAGYAAKNRFPAARDLAIAIASPCMEARSLFGWARLAFLQGDPVAWERGSESLIIYEKHRLTAQAKKVRTWLKEAFPPPSDGASAPPAFQISTTPRRPPRTGM
jgi:hypothetical protein